MNEYTVHYVVHKDYDVVVKAHDIRAARITVVRNLRLGYTDPSDPSIVYGPVETSEDFEITEVTRA